MPSPSTSTGEPRTHGDGTVAAHVTRPAPRTADDPQSLTAHAVSAFVHAPIAVAVCRPDGVVVRANDAMTRLLHHPADELLGRDLFRLVPEDLVGHALAACAALRDGSAETVVCETRFRTGDGHLLDVRVTTAAVRADATSHPHLIMHLEDTTEREDLRRRLQHEATHDPLTGLGNRVHFLAELQRALSRGERHGRPVTVLYLDLDGFKSVNDTHGHAAGDRLLIAFSRHLRESVRPEDTTARWGGDEFAVLCQDTTPDQAAAVVERLRTATWTDEQPDVTPPDRGVVRVGVTVGVATSPDADGHRLDAEELLHAADGAMYAAKSRHGRRHLVRGGR